MFIDQSLFFPTAPADLAVSLPPCKPPPSFSEVSTNTQPATQPTTSEPLLESEVAEISQQEFFKNLMQIQEMVKQCSGSRLPLSIHQNMDAMRDKIETLKKGYSHSYPIIQSSP